MINLDLNEYRETVLEDVRLASEAEMNDVTSEFNKYMTNNLIEAEEFEDFTECYFEGVGKRNKKIQIDGYDFDEVDKSLILVISDFSNEKDMAIINNTQIDKLFSKMEAFLENSVNDYIIDNYEESNMGYELAYLIKERLDETVKFRFYIITDKLMSDRVKLVKKGEIHGKPVELNIWDINRFFNLSQANMKKESIEIDVTKYLDKGLPCILAVDCRNEQYKSYLTMMPGDILAKLYIEYGARLLEGNVRSFLSIRGKVNKQIRNTILNQPEMFFAYNNGIAATATVAECEQNDGGLFITKLIDLQIINGGQTTASIANAVLQDKKDVSNIVVPVKLSIVDNEKAEEIIPVISKCANSQNKVDEADFFSNHPYHIRMEEYSRKTFAPATGGKQYQTIWFYERARGQHTQEQMKLSRTERNKYLLKNPKSQLIKKVDLAKYINTYNGYPHVVSKGAQFNMRFFAEQIDKQWKKSDEEFNVFYYQKVIALAIIFKETEKIVTNQEWYKEIKSYRANIVTYSLATIFNHIRKELKDFRFDFKRIWNSQNIYKELEDQIVITTKEIFDFITNDERPTLNVTEWCKKEACWTRAEKEKWTLKNEFLMTLISKDDEIEEKSSAYKNRKMENDINAELHVMQLGMAYWKKLFKWATERKLISPMENDILKIASEFELTGKLPSARQSKILMNINAKMIEEGYTY
ncbi:AIPR family protein [Clostridium beijerinckii]|uniref:AIPR family protein n=1 Tax=Clostridium beijerinckii TaxID=1520 RepID=UPI00037AD938|nr:AIPR family protein [Clostridium beijerinckii]